ncbi:DUF2461 domain-containing protein [Eubacterium callanderi]|uniref:DUF2461 domain-containing protein n=1 Tax=Eubacterium callanderi TaxID=53442 RepID=UPI0008F2AB3C|nr:DUF2461 domain-containing protein [Eubacterium callanderi]MBU5305291.1 DUF2461 domain-containing protein [Eubacterium callanderi]SFP58510.1 TIGR02453 family protein [Eubacterium callanderi]
MNDCEKMLDFLAQLRDNNSLEWMHSHQPEYKAARAAFVSLVSDLMEKLLPDEPGLGLINPSDLVFRLNRDTRFSKDKSPYTPAFRAHISPEGRGMVPVGDYLFVSPGQIFLGGGVFHGKMPEITRRIRDQIVSEGNSFEAVLEAPAFCEKLTLQGEKLKNVPRGYDKEHPYGELLKHKSWYVEYPVEKDLFLDREAFLAEAVDVFRRIKPFNDFINKALEGLEMPGKR